MVLKINQIHIVWDGRFDDLEDIRDQKYPIHIETITWNLFKQYQNSSREFECYLMSDFIILK